MSMPIYEYKTAEGEVIEVFQSINDKPLTVDPKTGQKVERVFSSFAIKFNGPGFHNTDYKKN